MNRTLIMAAAIAGIVIVSLSIHVVMLQVLWVPYPDMRAVGKWMRLYPLAQTLGLVWLAAGVVPGRSPVLRWVAVAALFAAMNGHLRNALMEAVTTTRYLAPLAGLVGQLLHDLILAGLAVAVVAVVRSPVGRGVGAVAITAASMLLISPVEATLLGPLTRWGAAHAHAVVYDVPYGANVLLPSYLSFAETVAGCLVARFVIAFPRARWDPNGLWQYLLLVLLVRGTLLLAALSPMIGEDPASGLLSMSQFVLQDLAMILLIQLVFARCLRAKTDAGGPSILKR